MRTPEEGDAWLDKDGNLLLTTNYPDSHAREFAGYCTTRPASGAIRYAELWIGAGRQVKPIAILSSAESGRLIDHEYVIACRASSRDRDGHRGGVLEHHFRSGIRHPEQQTSDIPEHQRSRRGKDPTDGLPRPGDPTFRSDAFPHHPDRIQNYEEKDRCGCQDGIRR
ncbi:hypothetical protein [Actinoplanes couchii]|uniref:Uncharacterized protein n=1 Tax=Actinoplanes couchii TaxID=403638 RepID=A0ABQ3XFJ8_9ACTN|nr:hypothetical protein [Actinoplanes couchii]MDR6321764.1 hypothetical protein [Actinoplanes couchii]GID57278.1 hypothetical protein Aco03nite_056820 [Actinoplanes couchii]